MNKVFIISKYVFISEEDHFSEVVLVCSTEELAKKYVADLESAPLVDLVVSYSYEAFTVLSD